MTACATSTRRSMWLRAWIKIQPGTIASFGGVSTTLPPNFPSAANAQGGRSMSAAIISQRTTMRSLMPDGRVPVFSLRGCFANGQLGRQKLSERHPKPVDVTNDELAHAVESIMRVFHNLNSISQASIHVIKIVGMDVKIDLAARGGARVAAGIEHEPAVAQCQQRPVQFAVLFVVADLVEADRRVPLHRGPHIGDMNHRDDCLLHFSPPLVVILQTQVGNQRL